MKYEIKGDNLPVVVCYLDEGEKMVTERGAMAWMSPNMKMETNTKGIGRAFTRIFTGESWFQNSFTAKGGPGLIAFASSFPGSIRAFEVRKGEEYIFQKKAFLASEEGVKVSLHLQRKFTSGLFSGEGLVLQKVSGDGIVFAEFDGHVVEYELKDGQQIVVDTGYLAAMSATCDVELVNVKGIRNVMFGGDGLFNMLVTGPGHVWLQTMPISSVAEALTPFFPVNEEENEKK